MAAILGLDLAAVEQACREAAEGELVSPANVNSPGQVVIAGHTAAVERAGRRCRELGARRALPLTVSAPFHCELMRPAQERLAADLAALTIADPRVPLVSNVDARVVSTSEECRDGLVRQVSGTVRWQQSLELLASSGVTAFVEVGPGTVLSGLVKKTLAGGRALNVESPETLEATLAALAPGKDA
jgi:[acyl-carrier-protein] S-malonyltransferase